MNQRSLKASVNLSHHKVTSGASGLQLVLLTAVSHSLSSQVSLLSSCQRCNISSQMAERSVPKADSRTLGLTYHLPQPVVAPCWLQLHQEGLYIPIASPHTGHIFQILTGDKAEDTVTVFSLGAPDFTESRAHHHHL